MPVVFQKYHTQVEQAIASRYYIFFILNWLWSFLYIY